MVKFKEWRDSYLFLKEYGSFTCLQCVGCNHNLDMNIEHSDNEYARFFCTKTISMVRLDFQFVCPEWENKNGETLTDDYMNKCAFNLPNEVIELLENDKEWTIEEIRSIVNEHEEVSE